MARQRVVPLLQLPEHAVYPLENLRPARHGQARGQSKGEVRIGAAEPQPSELCPR